MTCNGYKLETNIQKWVSTEFCSLDIITDGLKPRMFAVIIGHIIINTILRGIDKTLALGVRVTINAVLVNQYNKQKLQVS